MCRRSRRAPAHPTWPGWPASAPASPPPQPLRSAAWTGSPTRRSVSAAAALAAACPESASRFSGARLPRCLRARKEFANATFESCGSHAWVITLNSSSLESNDRMRACITARGWVHSVLRSFVASTVFHQCSVRRSQSAYFAALSRALRYPWRTEERRARAASTCGAGLGLFAYRLLLPSL